MAVLAVKFVAESNGNDSTGTGSEQAPYRTLAKAVSVAVPGTQIRMRGGNYSEDEVECTTDGTAANHIEIMAHEVGGVYEPVTMDGQNYTYPLGIAVSGGTYEFGTWFDYNFKALIRINANYYDVHHINFLNSRGEGFAMQSTITRPASSRPHHCTFRNCNVINCRAGAIVVDGYNNVELENVIWENAGNYAPFQRPNVKGHPGNHPGAMGIKFCDGLTIRNSMSRGHWGEGITISMDVVNVDVDGLFVIDAAYGNLYIHRVQNAIIRNCVSFYSDVDPYPSRSFGSGIYIDNEDWRYFEDETTIDNVLLHNNLMVNCDDGLGIRGGDGGLYPFRNVRMYNNTIVRPRFFGFKVLSKARFTGVIDFANNLIQMGNVAGAVPMGLLSPESNKIAFRNNGFSVLPAWPANVTHTGDVVGNMRLVNPNAIISGSNIDLSNYQLRTTAPASPAIGAGVDLSQYFTEDRFVVTRTIWSIGFHEASGVAGPTVPVINSFTATPNSFGAGGGTTTLAWNVTGADTLTINQGVGSVSPATSGSTGVAVTTSKTFTLTATNAVGSASAIVSVTVAATPTLPTINSFTATPSSLGVGGGAVALAWNVTGATSLSINQGIGSVAPLTVGTLNLTVSATTGYTLTATNAVGSVVTAAIVTVQEPAQTGQEDDMSLAAYTKTKRIRTY